MTAPVAPQPQRSAEEIDADLERVGDELIEAAVEDVERRAELFEREAALWAEMMPVAASSPFLRAVIVARREAADHARWYRGRAAERAAGAAEVLDGVR